MDEYKKRRAELISSDRALRADHKRDPFSPAEALADQVIRDLKTREALSIWSAESPSIPHPFPGMEFLTGREIIIQTKLFEILSKMPKGALLHVHMDATVNVLYLLKQALKYPAIHIRCSEPLTASNFTSILPEFRALPDEMYPDAKSLTSLTDVNYQSTWIPTKVAREQFDLGGPEAFDRWVIAAATINPSEAYGSHNTVEKIWIKFGTAFEVLENLIHYVPMFQDHVRELLMSSIKDGISYTEIRMNVSYRIVAADAKTSLTTREVVGIIDAVTKEVKTEMEQQGREDEFIGAKIVCTAFRIISPEDLERSLRDCIALKKEFPHLIAGFDLAGPENTLRPLIYYAEPLLKFGAMQKEAGVDEIPFLFHAGETLGDGTEADMNLYDAILLGTKRIGHGFSLIKHPKLVEICKEREIAIEVCPISNEVLRLTASMHMHPLPALINHGLHVVLGSDDPAIWGSIGVTFDFYQVLVSSEITGIIQLGEIAKDSIKFSTLSSEEKECALVAWQRRWIKFVEYVAEVGKDYLGIRN